jgi:hypothetical protein
MSAAARKLKISRRQARARLAAIRQRFEEVDLDEYFVREIRQPVGGTA